MQNQLGSSLELSVCTVEDDKAYLEFVSSAHRGIKLVPQPYGTVELGMQSDGADFAKWIKQAATEFEIVLPSSPKISLHSGDVWLPLIYLASDTSMQVFLNMVASYLYDKFKGNLPSDKPKVHMAIMYQDKQQGITKKFEFNGDADSLSKAVKRFDLDNFFR